MGRVDLHFLQICLYGKTGLILKPDTIIINHQLELSGTRVKYLDHEGSAFKHEIYSKSLLQSLIMVCPERLDV